MQVNKQTYKKITSDQWVGMLKYLKQKKEPVAWGDIKHPKMENKTLYITNASGVVPVAMFPSPNSVMVLKSNWDAYKANSKE